MPQDLRTPLADQISELRKPPLADHRETLPRDQYLLNFITQVQKFGDPHLQRAQNMQNVGWFYTTFDLIANISGMRQDVQNRKDKWPRKIPPAYSEIRPVNFGPLSRKQDMWVWTNPNRLIQETIFRLIEGGGALDPKIFTRARHWPRLASAHHKLGWGPPKKNFKGKQLKLGLNSTYARL